MAEQSARQRSLLLALIAFLVVLVIWQIPDLNGLLYPFRFFVTTVHELGHGLAAIVSGGYFVHYVVYPTGAGIARARDVRRLVLEPDDLRALEARGRPTRLLALRRGRRLLPVVVARLAGGARRGLPARARG
jgi:hypothetical protein